MISVSGQPAIPVLYPALPTTTTTASPGTPARAIETEKTLPEQYVDVICWFIFIAWISCLICASMFSDLLSRRHHCLVSVYNKLFEFNNYDDQYIAMTQNRFRRLSVGFSLNCCCSFIHCSSCPQLILFIDIHILLEYIWKPQCERKCESSCDDNNSHLTLICDRTIYDPRIFWETPRSAGRYVWPFASCSRRKVGLSGGGFCWSQLTSHFSTCFFVAILSAFLSRLKKHFSILPC